MSERCFPNTAELGELALDEVLLYHDGPRLFSCHNSTTGAKYLVVWVGEVNDLDSWLLAPSSDEAIEKVRKGHLEMRQPFMSSESGRVYKLSITGEASAIVEQIPTSALTEELLPAEGERLRARSTFAFRRVLAVAAMIMVVLSVSTWIQFFLLPREFPKREGIRFLIDGIEAFGAAVVVWTATAHAWFGVFSSLRDLFTWRSRKEN